MDRKCLRRRRGTPDQPGLSAGRNRRRLREPGASARPADWWPRDRRGPPWPTGRGTRIPPARSPGPRLLAPAGPSQPVMERLQAAGQQPRDPRRVAHVHGLPRQRVPWRARAARSGGIMAVQRAYPLQDVLADDEAGRAGLSEEGEEPLVPRLRSQAHRRSSWTAGIAVRGASPLRGELVRPQRTTQGKGKESTHSLPLSTYSAPGGFALAENVIRPGRRHAPELAVVGPVARVGALA